MYLWYVTVRHKELMTTWTSRVSWKNRPVLRLRRNSWEEPFWERPF